MLDSINLDTDTAKDKDRDFKAISAHKKRLSVLQHDVKDIGLPVIIIFEGWSAAGKGSKMEEVIKVLDARNYTTLCTLPPSADEARKPFMWRHWLSIPPKGRFTIYDRSWYPEASNDCVEKQITKGAAKQRLESINRFEKQLTDDGVLIIKFFLHISQSEQKARLDNLAGNADTAWRVVPKDYKRNKRYKKFYKAYDRMLEATNTPNAPWHVINGKDAIHSVAEIYGILTDSIEKALAAKAGAPTKPCSNMVGMDFKSVKPCVSADIDSVNSYPGADADSSAPCPGMELVPPSPPVLSIRDVDISVRIDPETYKARLAEGQWRLFSLHNAIYTKKIPLIIVYEGWDAAGKGGNIKRVTSALDPRGYKVIPTAAPTSLDLSYPFLRRFWQTLPKDGHIAIYDRSWYGRVLVERIEGFAREDEWMRAYREINEFENELMNWGAILVKFWLQIDKEEQLARFTARERDPAKRWKMNEEDWRNRDKWDAYETAVDDMLRLTSTQYAPWHIIESNDKKYARVKTIDILIDVINKRVNK